ncbi:MAG: CDP-alcohol phosphatidyltransferase family protein [Gammaproteobacteria bacterium]|nr:MAG: CDP-alcohol phosphatidyltransferase family protein [Gammaproteobacteria bacterium]
MKLESLPNAITLLRIVLIAPVVYLLLTEQYQWGLIVALIAGASDGVDGYLAKRYGWDSRLGAVLDPIADKLLLSACYIALAILKLLPVWLVVTVLVRDVVIVVGATIYHFRFKPLRPEPSKLSKLNTVAQIGLVLVVLFNQVWPVFSVQFLETLVWFVFATTVASGLHYVWVWSFKARDEAAAARGE